MPRGNRVWHAARRPAFPQEGLRSVENPLILSLLRPGQVGQGGARSGHRQTRPRFGIGRKPGYSWPDHRHDEDARMPQTPHVEKHFTSLEVVRDIVIGLADGLTVPFALAAGLAGAVEATGLI